MRRRADRANGFLSIFDEKTGFYYRSGVMEQGRDTGREPFMAKFPELIEVEIMGCRPWERNGRGFMHGEQCRQEELPGKRFHMAVEDFASIAEQSRGRAYQLILGGRGEAYLHEHFGEILKICVGNEIVPNVEVSGFGITKETAALCGKYCGAAGVKWHGNSYALKAIRMFQEAGVRTNIHFTLGKQTIQEAIDRLERVDFPQGINAVIFLTHKSAGQEEGGFSFEDERVRRFFALAEGQKYPFKLGFDPCGVQGLLRLARNIDFNCGAACEGARWSAYITYDMKMAPCRRGCAEEGRCVDLRVHSIQEAWDSGEFWAFRDFLKSVSLDCAYRNPFS